MTARGASAAPIQAVAPPTPEPPVGQLLAETGARLSSLLDAEPAADQPSGMPDLRDLHEELALRLERDLGELRPGRSPSESEARELVALHRLASRVLNEGVFPHLIALERLDRALDQLRELGPVSEIIDRGPAAAAAAADLDRVVLSRIDDGSLVAEAVHLSGDPAGAATTLAALRAAPARLEYPLIEGEVLRRRRPMLVDAGAEPRPRAAHEGIMAWQQFVTAPIMLDGRVIGFFHGDRQLSGRSVGSGDRDALWALAKGFAAVFERAILRRRLRVQRQEMRQIASWADAKTGELSERAIDLTTDRVRPDEQSLDASVGAPEAALRDLLTRREIDVLELLVKGETNAGIARSLVVAEGTVKFHVKNILRKLHASNRAEATSRYLRLTLKRGGGGWPA